MSDNQERDNELLRAAETAGLQKLYALDPDGFARAYNAAKGYRERRTVVTDLSLEPAHVYRLDDEGSAT